jgi:hypothetical protein
MKIITEYVQYLKDNPEGYWFKRKLYGWGWTPAKTQGWLVLGAYLVGVLYVVYRLEGEVSSDTLVTEFVLPLSVLTLLLIYVCYKKGEKPRWQWGRTID